MKFGFTIAAFSRRAARALAFVLLVAIIYSVTFSSAHSHQTGSFKTDTNRTTRAAVQPGSSFLVSTNSRSQWQGCLICLFHQQLFSSIAHTPLYLVSSPIDVASISSARLPFYSSSFTSTLTARLSGRAPPVC